MEVGESEVSSHNNFLTKWQTVIFRNYGLVPIENLAKVLRCEVAIIEEEAMRLGLNKQSGNSEWLIKGYITIIRNNWCLLDRGQIEDLLGISSERFDFILSEEDFLLSKLTMPKPNTGMVFYTPLTDEEKTKTKEIANRYGKYFDEQKYFGFFEEKEKTYEVKCDFSSMRIVHGFLNSCGDAFIVKSDTYLSDALLKEYAECKINGIWFHCILSSISPYPFKPALSNGYQTRRKNLKELILRAKRYGIKIYLYLNEPRKLPLADFKGFENLIGQTRNGFAALCFEHKQVKEYLYNAIYDLAKDVIGLGGIITITMSENLTHCRYINHTNCPICSELPIYLRPVEINNTIMKAVRDSSSDMEVIANLWGWSDYMGWTDRDIATGISMLDKDIALMCISEAEKPIRKGGVANRVIDYSIANYGPSKTAKNILSLAKKYKHKTYAKIQVNNSWECSCVPYLPVFDLIAKHVKRLKKEGVTNFMASWTLGGCPSPNLELTAYLCKGKTLDIWIEERFKENAKVVKKADKMFCKGFTKIPFDVNMLYFSPKNLGAANLWSLLPEGKKSAMTSNSYDDFETWTGVYGVEVYLKCMKKAIKYIKKSIDIFGGISSSGAEYKSLILYAKAAFNHLAADYCQTRFSVLKRDLNKNLDEIIDILKTEKKLAAEMLSLMKQDSMIGYEAANHYFYNGRNLAEKIINTDKLLAKCEELLKAQNSAIQEG